MLLLSQYCKSYSQNVQRRTSSSCHLNKIPRNGRFRKFWLGDPPLRTLELPSQPHGPSLPIEVCERIIDETTDLFDWDEWVINVKQFATFALVCRSWLPRSRTHLFKRVVLHNGLRTERFLRTLSDTPAFGSMVQVLKIFPREKGEGALYNWIYQAVQKLPKYLVKLQKLDLVFLPVLHSRFYLHLSRFTTMGSLSIQGGSSSFSEITQLTSRLPKLEVLELFDCSWKKTGYYFSGKQCTLKSLKFHNHNGAINGVDLLNWMIKSQPVILLTELRWKIHSDHIPQLNAILQHCAATLHKIVFEFHSSISGKSCLVKSQTFLACSL